MRTQLLTLSLLLSLGVLSACSPESTSLQVEKPLHDEKAPIPQYEYIAPDEIKWIAEDGGQSQLEFNPKVDILFVTDNSESMKSAQENLVKNMDRFTAGIMKNKMIDYHIGTLSVWDSSERYLKAKKDSYQIGDLRYIKDTKGQNFNRRFVTKAEKQYLASTLNIGVTPYDQGGPEFEEFFSPLSAALDKNGRGATNEEFFRDDAQLVVILVTDADDSTKDILPEQMAQKLIDFKKGRAEKIAAYGVLVRPKDDDKYKDWDLRIHPKYHPECFDMSAKTPKNNGQCTGFGPQRLDQFIVAANSKFGTPDQIRSKHIMSIVSPQFGTDLGKIGADITVKTLRKEIFLSQRPRLDSKGQLMIRVRYGTQSIPQKSQGGWVYNPEDNSIVLSGDIEYQYSENARFTVELVPLATK